jgi:glucosamine--fructose-6-phosphate aminotransferase (isomerizing)
MELQVEQQFAQAPGRPFAEAVGRQPAVLAEALPGVREAVSGHEFHLPPGASVAFVGIGASQSAAQTAAWSLLRQGRLAHRYSGSELPQGGAPIADAYVGTSQSGRSPEPLRALQRVEGVPRIAVTNEPGSPLAAVAEASLELGGLPDSGVSTIAYSATAAALSMLAERWSTGEADPRWDRLGTDLARLLDAHDGLLDRWASRFSGCRSVDVVGGGAWLGTAEAIALVLREALHLPAAAFETRAYLHGQMDSASGDSAQILLGGARERVLRDQLALRSTATLVIGTASEEPSARTEPSARRDSIAVDSGHLARDTVTAAALLHELALRWGARLGVDPDAPVFPRLDTKVEH